MSCASESEILEIAVHDRVHITGAVARHVRVCHACRARVADIRHVIAEIASSAVTSAASSDCLDEPTLAEFAEGGPDHADRTACIAHLVGCSHCREQLASIVTLLSDANVTSELQRLDAVDRPTKARGRQLLGASVIAAGAILAIVWPHRDPSAPSALPHRAPTISAAAAPTPISPSGDVGDAAALRWSGVPGADRYRVTLFDASGRVMYETQIIDTALTLPDSVVVIEGRSYLWKVEARTGFERWTSSDLTEFRLANGRAR